MGITIKKSANVAIEQTVYATVEVDASDVVEHLDRQGGKEDALQRTLTRLAADALALADDWDRSKVSRGEVSLRASAIRAGYLEVM